MLKFFLVAHLTYANQWGWLRNKIRTFGFFGTPYCPVVFAKEVGELGGSRHGGHLILSISQDPLTGCVVVLNSGRQLAQDDHVAGVARQLLWGEEIINQGRAETTQPEKRLR